MGVEPMSLKSLIIAKVNLEEFWIQFLYENHPLKQALLFTDKCLGTVFLMELLKHVGEIMFIHQII